MEVIKAIWEKRNLGVECVEFELSESEDVEKIKDTICSATAQYQIAKVPVGNVKMQLAVQECGFDFFETNIQLERKIDLSMQLPNIYARFAKDITYKDATQDEVHFILEEVSKGEMFTTDKVAQDPYFSPELSGKRYALWAKDILEKGAKTVLGMFRGEIASFTIYEDKGDHYQAFIGGMLNGYRDRGLGFMPLFVTGEHIAMHGGGILRTGVSSNNPSILKLQLLFGCSIKEMKNIYVKHITV